MELPSKISCYIRYSSEYTGYKCCLLIKFTSISYHYCYHIVSNLVFTAASLLLRHSRIPETFKYKSPVYKNLSEAVFIFTALRFFLFV
jgi:hypothetical protein